MIIDAKDLIIGRIATVAAKQALLGEQVHIVNAEKAIITGEPEEVVAKYMRQRNRGVPLQGPYQPRMPDRFVRRIIRGMLPWKTARGREAFKRVHCYIGVPKEFEGKAETIEEANRSKIPNKKFTSVGAVCKSLGASI